MASNAKRPWVDSGYDILNYDFFDYPNIPDYGQGWAIIADAHESMLHRLGITNPNLHRIFDIHPYAENIYRYKYATHLPDDPKYYMHELAERKYAVGIFGLNSKRCTETFTRPPDDSDLAVDMEIP